MRIFLLFSIIYELLLNYIFPFSMQKLHKHFFLLQSNIIIMFRAIPESLKFSYNQGY